MDFLVPLPSIKNTLDEEAQLAGPLADLKDLQQSCEGLANYAKQLIVFVKSEPSRLVGPALQETLRQFDVLCALIESNIMTFNAQVSTYTITSQIATTYPTEFLSMNSLCTSLGDQLRAILPTTMAVLNAVSMSPDRHQSLMANFVTKLKAYSGDVSQLRELLKTLWESEKQWDAGHVIIPSVRAPPQSYQTQYQQQQSYSIKPTPQSPPLYQSQTPSDGPQGRTRNGAPEGWPGATPVSPGRGPVPSYSNPASRPGSGSTTGSTTSGASTPSASSGASTPNRGSGSTQVAGIPLLAATVSIKTQQQPKVSSPADRLFSPRSEASNPQEPLIAVRGQNGVPIRAQSTAGLKSNLTTQINPSSPPAPGRNVAIVGASGVPPRSGVYTSVTADSSSPPIASAPSTMFTPAPAPVPIRSASTNAMPSFFMSGGSKLSTFDPSASPLTLSSNMNSNRSSANKAAAAAEPTSTLSTSPPSGESDSARNSATPSLALNLDAATSPEFNSNGTNNGAPLSPNSAAGAPTRYRRVTNNTSELRLKERLTVEEEEMLAQALEDSVTNWELLGDEAEHAEPPSALAANINKTMVKPNTINLRTTTDFSRPASENFSASVSEMSDSINSSLLSDNFAEQLEGSLAALYATMEKIAHGFSNLGACLLAKDSSMALDRIEGISRLSQALLTMLDDFKTRYVTDPLLVSSFTDLVQKFEYCAVNFYTTASRVMVSYTAQAQLELSASTRAFSTGISGLLEFLMHQKAQLIESASNVRARKHTIARDSKSETGSGREAFASSSSYASGSLVDEMWSEPQTEQTLIYEKEGDKATVKLATLHQLIIHLTHETKTDMDYMKTFLSTYHSFTTTPILVQKLIARYHVPPSVKLSDAQIKVVRLRVINAFKTWFKMRFDDFTTELLQPVLEFLGELKRDKEWAATADGLSKLIDQSMEEVVRLNATESSKQERQRDRLGSAPGKMQSNMSPTDFLFSTEPLVIAQQLSRLEFSIWKKLKPSELMNQSWAKPELKHKSPHVCELISRFNSVSHFVASVILWQERLVDRVKVVQRLIEIAAVLDSMNNFNSALEILAGFNNSAVHRLKFTFADLSKKHQQQLQSLQRKLDSAHNYKVYRDELRNCNPPVLPYLGVYLTDLTFIEDGNKNTLNGLINFNKRRQLYKVLREIEQYQVQAYDLTVVPAVFNFLSELPHNDNDELFRISLLREPRGTENKASIL